MNDHASSSTELAGGLKRRIIILVLTSTLVVALTFGLSFYFAFLSNETAVASKIPELQPLIGTLKRILLVNTIAFVAVLIASLYALTALVTQRMFRPLESIMRDLATMGRGALPEKREPVRDEPFSGFDEMFGSVVSVLHEREEREIEEIRLCLSILETDRDSRGIRANLERMLRDKGAFIRPAADRKTAGSKTSGTEDTIFLQPV